MNTKEGFSVNISTPAFYRKIIHTNGKRRPVAYIAETLQYASDVEDFDEDDHVVDEIFFPDIDDHISDCKNLSEDHLWKDKKKDLLHTSISVVDIEASGSRFYILWIFSFLCCLQCLEWNSWGPISESVEAAFPGWNSSTVAMMGNWGSITFVLFILPMVYLIHTRGLRVGMLTCAVLIAVGTSLRCLTLQTPAFIILCHLCAIFVGIPGTVVMAAPPLVAALWFPPRERTTATAAGVSIVLLATILIWFPARPAQPPSWSSTTKRLKFGPALKTIFRKKKFLLILASYSLFLGFPSVWMSVLNFSFLVFGIQQEEAMFIGILAIFFSSAAALVVGGFTDRFYGRVRESLVVLILASLFSFTWFMLLSVALIPPTKWQVYFSVILGVSANIASSPLFFELGVEIAYPVPEAIVGGVLTTGNNFIGILFLLLFVIPSEGYTWVTYCLVGGSLLSVLPVLFVKEEYLRSKMDGRISESSTAQGVWGKIPVVLSNFASVSKETLQYLFVLIFGGIMYFPRILLSKKAYSPQQILKE